MFKPEVPLAMFLEWEDLLSPVAAYCQSSAASPVSHPHTPCTPNLGCSADGPIWDLHHSQAGALGAAAARRGYGAGNEADGEIASEGSEWEESCAVDSLSFHVAATPER